MKYLALLLIFGFGISGSLGQTIKSLGYNTTNGQVVYGGTNALTFTNRFRQSSDSATNPPEIRLTTKSNNVASWFYYDAFGAGGANTTNDVDWSVLWLGNNHVPSSSGLDFGRADQSIGAISLTMENMYYAGSLPSPSHVGEFYLNISDYTTNGIGTTRALFIVGSQTNSSLGQSSFAYPVYINYQQQSVDWLNTGSGLGGLNVGTTNSYQLATFFNTGTAFGGEARISLGAPANQMAVAAGPNYGWIRQFGAARTAFYITTNGVIYGSTQGNATASAPVHLAGNTRIDGAISFNADTNAATTRTNLGLGWSALTNSNSATSLIGVTTNGQVVANTGTNALTFTNRFRQSSTNATNPPEIRLTTKSNNVASWFVYDAVQTNPAAPNWSVAFMGLNTVPKSDGTDRALLNQSIGGASFTIENMWVSPTPDPDAPLAEFYFNITDTNNFTTRGFSVVGNQTNSTIGFADFTYPLTIFYNTNSRAWYGGDTLGLNVFSTNTGELARFTHSTTNPSGTAQIYLQVQNNQTIWLAGRNYTTIRNYEAGRNAFRVETNGVIYGATGANDAPQAPVHLAGNTRIDGAISFDNTTNAATTRTNLGLGGGITATNTFVSYNGTNYTTNTVTISNGIITGWTQ